MENKISVKKVLAAYALAAGAGLIMCCSFAGLDSWEEKRNDKRKLESDLEYTKGRLEKTQDRLEDSDRTIRTCRIDLDRITRENLQLQKELDRLKAEAKGPEGFRT